MTDTIRAIDFIKKNIPYRKAQFLNLALRMRKKLKAPELLVVGTMYGSLYSWGYMNLPQTLGFSALYFIY